MTKQELEKERARVRLANDWGWDEKGNPLPPLSDKEADAKIFGRIPKALRKSLDPEMGIGFEIDLMLYEQKKTVAALQKRITKLKAENEKLKAELARRS